MNQVFIAAILTVSAMLFSVSSAQAAQSETEFLGESLQEISQELKCAKTSEEKSALLLCRAMINRDLGRLSAALSDRQRAVLLNPANAEILDSFCK